jgi:hypothetical protein
VYANALVLRAAYYYIPDYDRGGRWGGNRVKGCPGLTRQQLLDLKRKSAK